MAVRTGSTLASSLPEGKSCQHCGNFKRCQWLFQCRPQWTTCDWIPSRFFEKPTTGGEGK